MNQGDFFYLAGDGHLSGYHQSLLLDRYSERCFTPNKLGKDFQSIELEKQKWNSAKFLVFIISPHIVGFDAIIELIDSSNTNPDKTLFFFSVQDGDEQFSSHQIKSLKAIGEMVEKNGGSWFKEFDLLKEKLDQEFLKV